MATYNLAISDTRFVFNSDYDCISFYTISQGKIALGETLLDASQHYVKLKLVGSTLQVENGVADPEAAYEEYGNEWPIADVWNSPSELIVGTGDIRPSGVDIVPDKFPMSNKGIVITSPSTGVIRIYQLT